MAINVSASRPGAVSHKASIDFSNVPAEFRGLLEEQKKMNEEQQLVTRLTNLLKHKHDVSMAVLNNMR